MLLFCVMDATRKNAIYVGFPSIYFHATCPVDSSWCKLFLCDEMRYLYNVVFEIFKLEDETFRRESMNVPAGEQVWNVLFAQWLDVRFGTSYSNLHKKKVFFHYDGSFWVGLYVDFLEINKISYNLVFELEQLTE